MRLLQEAKLWIAVLPMLVTASSAYAEEGGDKAGLPQFDTSLFPEQIFWLVVTFGVLYLLMAKVALPRIAATQSNRKTVIAGEIEAARFANETAKATLADLEKSLAAARAKAHVEVTDMIAEVAKLSASKQAAQEHALQRKLHAAEADIAVTKQKALASVEAAASDLGVAIVDKILGRGRVGA